MNERVKRGRAALVMIAIAALVIVVAAPGADAKKKHKGGSRSVTVAAKAPVAVPAATPAKTSFVAIPLTVGKKGKNKVVNGDSVAITYTLTGAPATGGPVTPGALYFTSLSLTAPNGRTVGLDTPQTFSDPNATTVGPITETANSPFGPCNIDVTGVPGTTICDSEGQDPEGTLLAPTYAGTQGNNDLSLFTGVRAKGTWLLKVRNFSETKAAAVAGASLRIGLTSAPSSK